MKGKEGIIVIALVGAIGASAYFMMRKGKTTADILNELFPGGFTASVSQLDALVAAGYPQGSKVYQEALDIAYNKAKEGCTGVVSWSSAQGYYCESE